MLQKLWYDQPVRTQLLVVVAGINLLAALIAGAVSILNTRTATQVEMEASLEVAERFVAVTVKDLDAQGKLDQLSQELPAQLKHLRHVRIMFLNDAGELAVVSPPAGEDGAPPRVPAWFAALVRPETGDRKVRVLAGDANPIIVRGEPADEIAGSLARFFVARSCLARNQCPRSCGFLHRLGAGFSIRSPVFPRGCVSLRAVSMVPG